MEAKNLSISCVSPVVYIQAQHCYVLRPPGWIYCLALPVPVS